jgi:hypothetical protein
MTDIAEGDWVRTPSGQVDWFVDKIFSRIDPLGVRLVSGMTERVRYEDYEQLVLYKKGS